MDREEIRTEVRARSLVEDTQVTDTTINTWINSGLLTVRDRYPLPVSVVVLSTDGATPAFANGYHDMIVDYVLGKVWEREEFFEQSISAFASFEDKLARMIRWYNGGNT